VTLILSPYTRSLVQLALSTSRTVRTSRHPTTIDTESHKSMRIIDLNTNPTLHENTEITIAGAVRVTYSNPFPHFVIEDDSGTLLCRPKGSLPWPGAHIEITGSFASTTPENCTIQLPILTEINRAYIGHKHTTATYPASNLQPYPTPTNSPRCGRDGTPKPSKRRNSMAQLIEPDGTEGIIVTIQYAIEFCGSNAGWSWRQVD
jgi:hypothetical protein